MIANASMGWLRHEGILVVVPAPGVPNDADWSQFMADVRSAPFQALLVFAPNAKLSPKQRKEVKVLSSTTHARGAVVTDSTVARGVVTALGWFGVPIKAFASTNLPAALDYVGVALDKRGDVEQAVGLLERTLREANRQAAG